MAGGKQGAGQADGEQFDVRVAGWGGNPARTLQGLQDLFGLDRAAAQRLIDSIPAVVRRAAPANEAQHYQLALRGLGAQVQLLRRSDALGGQSGPGQSGTQRAEARRPPVPGAGEPPATRGPATPAAARPPVPPAPPARSRSGAEPPTPPRAAPAPKLRRPPPPPRVEDDLPRPVKRVQTSDLEFDLPSAADPDDEPLASAAGNTSGSGGRVEFEFNSGDQAHRLELDLDHGNLPGATPSPGAPALRGDGRGLPERAEPHSLPARKPELRAASKEWVPPDTDVSASGGVPADQSGTRPVERRAAGPMSRAEVVRPVVVAARDPRRRRIALLRVLGAIIIAAGGVWLDSSIAYGNASLMSVLAHAIAIYQLGLGVRGLSS